MSEAYQFAIGRSRALILAGCFVAAAALLFFAGAITGTLYTAGHQSSAAVATPSVKVPELPAVKASATGSSAPPAGQPASVAEAPTSGSATNTLAPEESPIASSSIAADAAPAATASVNTEDPAASSSATASASTSPPAAAATANAEVKPQPAAKPAPASAPTSRQATATSYAVQLAVRVGSFSVKSNAEALTRSLRDMGYQPTLSRSTDIHGRDWYVVKLGPYTKWNTASVIATRISIAENVTPVIGPME
jgi:septal ring-binding cell division protein DamX